MAAAHHGDPGRRATGPARQPCPAPRVWLRTIRGHALPAPRSQASRVVRLGPFIALAITMVDFSIILATRSHHRTLETVRRGRRAGRLAGHDPLPAASPALGFHDRLDGGRDARRGVAGGRAFRDQRFRARIPGKGPGRQRPSHRDLLRARARRRRSRARGRRRSAPRWLVFQAWCAPRASASRPAR
jgi:hypothetical protein